MASALPGQLGPVRLLGWQRLLSVKVWCPCGRFCQSWQRPGITVTGQICVGSGAAFFVLPPYGERSVNKSAVLLECISLWVPQTHIHINTDTLTPNSEKNTHKHSCWHTCTYAYTLWNTLIHTLEHTLIRTCSLSLFLSLSHTYPSSSYLIWGSGNLLFILFPCLGF